MWRERIAGLGLDPRHVVLLKLVAHQEGRSQLALGRQMGLPPSRMVAVVDELENLKMLERRPNPRDRRMRTLYLTDEGRRTLDAVDGLSGEHEGYMSRGLSRPEIRELARLLTVVAAEHGLTPEV